VSRVTDADGWLEFSPPPYTHARLAVEGDLAPVGGSLVPDTCRAATVRLLVRGRARLQVTLPGDASVPETIGAEHPDATVFPDRKLPKTALALEFSAPLAGGRTVAVYGAPLRSDVRAPVRLFLPASLGGSSRTVALQPDAPVALDLSR
jgi:hypothetical protein